MFDKSAFKRLVALNGLSMRQVANQLGIAGPTVWRWGNGTWEPSPENAVKLAELLGVPLGELYTDEDVRKHPGEGDVRPSVNKNRLAFNYSAFTRFLARKGLSKSQVSASLGLSRTAVVRWAKGKSEPSPENALKLANLLGVSIDDLITPDVDASGTADASVADARRPSSRRFVNTIVDIPVFCDASVCCGDGFDLAYATPSPEPDFYVPAEKAKLGPIDAERPPYALRADGDSMAGAGIPSGAYVIVNPSLPAVGRFPAHVRYLGRDMIRFVECRDGLPVALNSSNPELYPSIEVRPEEDESQELFIFGRVVMVIKSEEINPAF